ncbi:MAG: type II toxin-antitoxin system RelE/ParE family toxin [Lachnospiraceae bacterium]|nr:type II toxin-antitoxin system RelE/ParE family toxin [Lachnospiraceae bacterium]
MKQYKIKITPYANEQLKEIRDYIAKQLLNPGAARNTILAIRKEVGSLNKRPDRLRPVDEEPWGSRGVRKIVVKNYCAYYWIDEAFLTVHVIAVVYAKRDQANVLKQIRE